MERFSGERVKNWLVDVLFDLMGSVLYALGVHVFTAPNQIAPGGVTGIATLVNYLTGLPIGTVSLFINIPLLFLSYKLIGHRFTTKTLKTLVIITIVLDVVFKDLPVYTGDMILVSLFGGVLVGAGLALVFMRDSTTGGGDIAARLLQMKMPYLPIGRAIFLLDCVVLLVSALVYQRLESAMYGMIVIFACSQVLDSILYGLDVGKMVLVVSDYSDEIARRITNELERGATLLQGRGAYSGNEKSVILSAVRRNEFHKLKDIVHQVDPSAFLIVAEAGEVLGEGFKPIQKKTA